MSSGAATGHTIFHHPAMNAVTFIKKINTSSTHRALSEEHLSHRTFYWNFSKQPPIENYWIDSFKSLRGNAILSFTQKNKHVLRHCLNAVD